MFPTWTILGLGSVVLAVGGTLFDKYLLSKYFGDSDQEAGPGALLIFSSYFSVVIIIGLLLYGYSTLVFESTAVILALTAGVLNGTWILLYLQALVRSDVSKTAPILQTIPAFGLVLAYLTLGETLSAGQLTAIVILLFGTLVLLHEKRGGVFNLDLKTLALMLSSAFFVALSQTMFKVATTTSNYLTATTLVWVGFLLFGLLLHLGVRSYREQFSHMFSQRVKSVFSLNAGNEIFDSVGELLLFAAIILGPLALVQSLNVYEPVLIFVVSIALTLLYPKYFSESLTQYSLIQKCIGILIVLLGSVVLYTNL